MKFHPEKCKVMRIGREHPDFTYEMASHDGAVPLLVTHVEKDLGVMVDDSLRFREHMQQATLRANKLLGIIRRTYHFLDAESLLFLYRGLVRPSLEYGVFCLYSCIYILVALFSGALVRIPYYGAAQHLAGVGLHFELYSFVFRWCRVAARWLESAAIAVMLCRGCVCS